MADFPFDLVGFDLDGTLLDTSPDLVAAVNHALASLGRKPLSWETVRPMIGQGTHHMFEQALAASGGPDAAAFDAGYAALLDFYAEHIAVGTRAYPGLEPALDALAARGVTLAVATNKLEALARKLLDEVGLGERFALVIGGETLGPGSAKPAPDMIAALAQRGRTAFAGDSVFDIQAARAAGVPSIAVSFGFSPVPAAQLGADGVIDRYDQLLPTLEALGAR